MKAEGEWANEIGSKASPAAASERETGNGNVSEQKQNEMQQQLKVC